MINLESPYHLIHLPSVDSTNLYAGRLLQDGDVSEGTVILADYQEKGKGQGGSQWTSNAGSNLLFSLVLKPVFLPAERQFYLSMCISNALAELVMKITGDALIKWPNDILVNNRKIAGILIENTVMGDNLNSSIIGIGLNVNQAEFPPDLPYAVSLKMATGREYSTEEVLIDVLKCISSQLEKLYDSDFAYIRTVYLNNLAFLNRWTRFTDSAGAFEGRITDVADSGELIVQKRNGEVKEYGFKEVSFRS